jgi:WD40 repeat protein
LNFLKNEIIAEVPTLRAIKSSPITSMCLDDDLNNLYTGDSNGYITIWSYSAFVNRYNLNEPIDLSVNSDLFNLVVCWRAHVGKIVELILNPDNKLLFSASADESVRVWWGYKGKYIGYLGQKKAFAIPSKDLFEFTPPIDITEPPIFVNKSKSDKKMDKKYEYPLVLDKKK